MRRAARTDGNHADVVAALRGIGAAAWYLREPVDLLVGFRGINLLLEIKDGTKPPSERALTAKEAEFIATWPGQRAVVLSAEEAVAVVLEAARPLAGA